MIPQYRVFAVLGNIALPFSGPFLQLVDAAPRTPPPSCGWRCVMPLPTPFRVRSTVPVQPSDVGSLSQFRPIATSKRAPYRVGLGAGHSEAVDTHFRPSDTPSSGSPPLTVMVTPITGVWTAGNRRLSSKPMVLLERVLARGPQTAIRLVCRTRPDARAGARRIPAVPDWGSGARTELPGGRSRAHMPRRGPVWCRGP